VVAVNVAPNEPTTRDELQVVTVNPKGTTRSEDHEYVMRKCGLDKHTASAYLIALRARRNLQRP